MSLPSDTFLKWYDWAEGACIGFFVGIWVGAFIGYTYEKKTLDLIIQEQRTEIARVREAQASTGAIIVSLTKDRSRLIHEKQNQIKNTIPAGAYMLPGAFVELYNASAGYDLPADPGRATPPALDLRTATDIIRRNNEACLVQDAHYQGLIEWVDQMRESASKPATE